MHPWNVPVRDWAAIYNIIDNIDNTPAAPDNTGWCADNTVGVADP